MSALSFRPYLPRDAETLASLFAESVLTLGEDYYSEGQLAAWASRVEDMEAFSASLAGMTTILAETEGETVGFASLKDDKHIEMLYVLPDAARQGIGRALVNVMELLAGKRGTDALSVDASEVAVPLFEKLGYEAQKRNTVMIEDEWLANTTMTKALPKGAPQAAGNA
jgi:putative acetyltransferase